MSLLNLAQIRQAFETLNGEMAARGSHAELTIAGGAALALRFSARRTTRDIDAVVLAVSDAAAFAAAVHATADRLSLPRDWHQRCGEGVS